MHHVGSTSVPGLCAKPILDLMVSVPNFEDSLALVPELEQLGYEFRPDEEIPGRRFFRRSNGILRTHHLSLAERFAEDRKAYLEAKSGFIASVLRDATATRNYSST